MRKTNDHIVLESGVNWLHGRKSILYAKEVQTTICTTGGALPGGEDREWSSEHLFLAAMAGGYTAGFMQAAAQLKMHPVHFTCDAVGTLENNAGHWRFWQIDLYPRIVVPGTSDRALVALADVTAREACPVYHALNTEVIFHTSIIVEPNHPSGT
ncbi:MAG: OsmC family protein [Bacteroidota bacterium]|nr:OsmC family protein [Bacteroidota bacterium]